MSSFAEELPCYRQMIGKLVPKKIIECRYFSQAPYFNVHVPLLLYGMEF